MAKKKRKGRDPRAYTCTLKKARQLCRSFRCRCGCDLILDRRGVPGDQPKCPRCGRQYVVDSENKGVTMIHEPEHAPVAETLGDAMTGRGGDL